jgi:hypothetical protein
VKRRPRPEGGHHHKVRLVGEPFFGSNHLTGCVKRTSYRFPLETFAVDVELKRAARGVIERIVNLRDSL